MGSAADAGSPAAADVVTIEYREHDHRVRYAPDPVAPMILDLFTLDVVVRTQPEQRRVVGTINHARCQVWTPDPMPPILSQLDCFDAGLATAVSLVRVTDTKVEVRASEGEDGRGSAPARNWVAGTLDLPAGQAVSSVAIDEDVATLDASLAPPLALELHTKPLRPALPNGADRTLAVRVATEPPQQVALGPWDGSGCELHAPARRESTSRVAFLACPRGPGPARESLLIAFVDARAAELWAVAADNSVFGRVRKLGRLALPRDRVLDVHMIEDAAP